MAHRVQLSRQRGARIPEGAVNVARPGRFGVSQANISKIKRGKGWA